MKIFSCIQELWDYCLHCPVCQKSNRSIHLSVGPDYVFKLKSFEKQNNSLILNCAYQNKTTSYLLEHTINCLTNTFDLIIKETDLNLDFISTNAVNKAYFYFYLQAHCNCDCSSIYSADLELDLLDRKIPEIKLEREVFWIFEGETTYQLSLYHDTNNIMFWHCSCSPNKDCKHYINLSMFDLDWADKKKLIKKLKTVLIFN